VASRSPQHRQPAETSAVQITAATEARPNQVTPESIRCSFSLQTRFSARRHIHNDESSYPPEGSTPAFLGLANYSATPLKGKPSAEFMEF
jgi:hypothetical protein